METIRDCQKIQARLSEYIDSALPEEQQWETQQHLTSCAVCSRVADELTATTRLLAFLPREEPSASFEENLARRLAAQALRPQPPSWRERLALWWSQPRVRPALTSGLALAALVPVAFVVLNHRTKTVPSVTVPAATEELELALQDHLEASSAEAFGDSSGVLLSATPSGPERAAR